MERVASLWCHCLPLVALILNDLDFFLEHYDFLELLIGNSLKVKHLIGAVVVIANCTIKVCKGLLILVQCPLKNSMVLH